VWNVWEGDSHISLELHIVHVSVCVQVTELHIVIAATSSNACSFGECMGSDFRERRTAPPPLSGKPSNLTWLLY
jgi:hypothetical protein